jgi:hypothetical protein
MASSLLKDRSDKVSFLRRAERYVYILMLLIPEVKRRKTPIKGRLQRNEIKAGYLLHVFKLSILVEEIFRTEEVAYEQA